MSEYDDPVHPLYPSHDTIQEEHWIVYYKGMSGRWLSTSPHYFKENALRFASKFDRPTKILHYTLESVEDIDTGKMKRTFEEADKKEKKPRVRKPIVKKPIVKKVRMPKRKDS